MKVSISWERVLAFSLSLISFGYLFRSGKLPFLSISKKEEEVRYVTLKLSELWNTVMFFPDPFPEDKDSTTNQMIWYMEQAKETLAICLYRLNFQMLEEALMKISAKGIRVRILTNDWTWRNHSWREAGIQTRSKNHRLFSRLNPDEAVDLMHHKFVIIDDYAILTGSLNWTTPGITKNKENVMITTEQFTRKGFQEEFNRLWEESVHVPGRPVAKEFVDPSHPDWDPENA